MRFLRFDRANPPAPQGFVIGLVACAVLDLIEKMNARLLRCKFPEFVKINLAILACAAAILLFGNRLSAAAGPEAPSIAIAYVVACCLVIKLADIVLSTKKGLAAIVVALAAWQRPRQRADAAGRSTP